jgi:hypothetical protein
MIIAEKRQDLVDRLRRYAPFPASSNCRAKLSPK